ncbi:transglutaminase-like enzyme, predicted cysteine protease [Opitutaceae bacterium TAV1]|nr:transglutaminase-like enzyme, predicted cysteine protease [Opitutaceae bacterium TAV1]
MILDATCDITYTNESDVPALFMLRPRSGWAQWIMEDHYHIGPRVQMVEFTDLYGNLCQRLVMPPGEFRASVKVRADVQDRIDVDPAASAMPVQTLPTDVLHYLLPSRYCQSDRMGDLALEIVGQTVPGYPSAEAIRAWINKNIHYQYGTSDASTSAVDTVRTRQGVCRDFAHLGIALCRCLSIPARMVVGFLHELDPMDLHAWFEAYVNGRWFTFDATQDQPRGNRIVVAYGRDAADVALVTTFAPTTLNVMRVTVSAAPVP